MNEAFMRLAPMAARAGVVHTGRHRLSRLSRKLRFILVTQDISANSRREILALSAGVPVVQLLGSADIEELFGMRGTKVVGFVNSSIADSLYRLVKDARIQP